MRASRPCWRQGRWCRHQRALLFLRLLEERAAVVRGPRRATLTRAPRAQGALAAAQQQRAAQAAEFPAAAGRALRGCAEPEWLADAPARGALRALCLALIRRGAGLRRRCSEKLLLTVTCGVLPARC